MAVLLLLALIGDTLLLLLPAVMAELSAGPSAAMPDMDVVNRCLLTIERGCCGCSNSDGAPLLPVDIDDDGIPAAMTVFFIDDDDGFLDDGEH